jgi:predicted nucleotidyltransferase
MKTSLPEKSKLHHEKIHKITNIVLEAGGKSVVSVILFGSFARGDWVLDVACEEDGNTFEYASDYDFLIITRTPNQASGKALFELEKKIDKSLKAAGLSYGYKSHDPHFIVEPIKKINSALENGQYFFIDIKKEGILLHDSGEFEFVEIKEVGEEAKKRIAKGEYERWIGKSENFLIKYKTMFDLEQYVDSAFDLHQAA